MVGDLDSDTVRRLLVAAAEHNEDVARAVRLASADATERVKALKAEVDRGLRTRRFLGYRESSAWAIEASPVVDALADAVARDPTRDLVVLLERAVGHVVKVILHADDSDGLIGDLARRILDLHEQACDAGVADPVALAKWMIRFNFDDQDFFVADPFRYAQALGDDGVALFRREVVRRSATESSFAARYALERLAVLDGDVDRIVAVLGGDLTAPHQFIQVVEALREIGRDDDALSWAQRGIKSTTGWQVTKLVDHAAELVAERGDAAAVLELRRDHHQRMPSSTSYAALQTAAEDVGRWSEELGSARAVLGNRDPGGLVDALLADGDADEAWKVATEDTGWDAGGQRWQRLAEAREEVDPAAALAVYLRLADNALVDAGRRNYQIAASHLKAARRAATAAGTTSEFEAHVRSLREVHRRRPTFIQIIDKAGLP